MLVIPLPGSCADNLRKVMQQVIMIIIIVPSPVQTLTLGIHFIIIPGYQAAKDRYLEYARRDPVFRESFTKYQESEPEGEQLILCVHYEY